MTKEILLVMLVILTWSLILMPAMVVLRHGEYLEPLLYATAISGLYSVLTISWLMRPQRPAIFHRRQAH